MKRGQGRLGTGFAIVLLPLMCLAKPGAVSAQQVYLYSEPTVCSTPFTPRSGVTFHAGGQFPITWYLPVAAMGPIDYAGVPDPVKSTDRTKRWSGPSANVTCFIDWFQLAPTPQRTAQYRWHINYYGGAVTNCKVVEDHTDARIYSADYDPYSPGPSDGWDLDDGCSGGGGGGDGPDGPGDDGDSSAPIFPVSGGGGGRSMCPDNAPMYWDIDCIDLYIEGSGWVEYWCGAVLVCG